MIQIDNQLVSYDIIKNKFVCDLKICKGKCCIEGDIGAPLTIEETILIEKEYNKIKLYLSQKNQITIEKNGKYIENKLEKEWVTPLVNGKECAYTIIDKKGMVKCAIEKAYEEKKIEFNKPISCHMYPIRIENKENHEVLRYDKWSICEAACLFGEKLQTRVYKFLKNPLIRKFGEEWYKKLDAVAIQFSFFDDKD